MKRAMPLTFTSASVLLWATIVAALAIDEATFTKLHAQLQPPQDEAWRELPWQDSILKARTLAAMQKKPIYMLVRSGHPLGCV
jgi:sterol desaturase/sphingolipid hydroxylase (fatty acid hydroxylase superfamily)